MRRTKKTKIAFSVVYEHQPHSASTFTVIGQLLFPTYDEAYEIGRLTAVDCSYNYPVVVKHIIAVPV
jgi:hypothetical protein